MNKLKLDDLEVTTFATTSEEPGARGTVRAHQEYSRWDCSIDWCSEGGGCGPSADGHCQSYHQNPCYPSFFTCPTMNPVNGEDCAH